MTLLDDLTAGAPEMPEGCDHAGTHSPIARYARKEKELRYMTVCDACGAEMRFLHREAYTPSFDPAGNLPYLTRAPAVVWARAAGRLATD